MTRMKAMQCAVCGAAPFKVLFEAALPDPAALDFSARRSPMRAHCRVVRCIQCGLVFSNPYFPPDTISGLYRDAGFISEPQLINMARDYHDELARALPALSKDANILEIGCGNGFFLKLLHDAGFRNLTGVEPGAEARRRAAPEIRESIRSEFFDPSNFAPASFDLVCCFQVFDHVLDPATFVDGIAKVLKPGGHIFAINHNIRALSARVLGERSPMYDIEHVYLFDPATVVRLLENHRFGSARSRAIANSYALAYFLKMLPLPQALKRFFGRRLEAAGLDTLRLRLPGGNMATVAQRR